MAERNLFASLTHGEPLVTRSPLPLWLWCSNFKDIVIVSASKALRSLRALGGRPLWNNVLPFTELGVQLMRGKCTAIQPDKQPGYVFVAMDACASAHESVLNTNMYMEVRPEDIKIDFRTPAYCRLSRRVGAHKREGPCSTPQTFGVMLREANAQVAADLQDAQQPGRGFAQELSPQRAVIQEWVGGLGGQHHRQMPRLRGFLLKSTAMITSATSDIERGNDTWIVRGDMAH